VATTLYFAATAAPPVSPTTDPDAGWTSTSLREERALNDVKGSTAIAVGSTIDTAAGAGSSGLDRVYVSRRLNGAQTISGTADMQLMVREFATTDNVDRGLIKAYVVNAAATSITGTLLALGNYGPTLEFINNATCRNKTYIDGDAITTVNANDNDRIVLEIGYQNSAAGTTPQAAAKWGENATDLPVNETQTTDGAGWFKLSATLTFRAEAAVAAFGMMLD
jgi:hypothetical protein